jgi:RHS repeat-associated protein
MRTSVTEQDGRKVDYKYDNLYRLTEEKITDVTNGNRTTSYVMDKVGNRTSKADSVSGATTYVYDNNDKLLSETTGSQITTYAYDAKGNNISKTKGTEVTLYTWNDQGRLVAVQNPNSDAISYQYNENGIRVNSTINGVKTSFLLDSNRDYAQVLEEYTSTGVQVNYVYGHDLISQSRSGVKSFYIYDGLGTTKALTNSAGLVTDRYLYDAYGNVLSSSGTTQNKYLYTGEQFDSNLGQYYLRDRFYNQAVGRFTRADTFAGNFESPLSLNKYLYANGNSVNAIDPSGYKTTIFIHSGTHPYGHAAIDVNGTVYTFGRYVETNTSLYGLNADGYLFKVPEYNYLSNSKFTPLTDSVDRYSLSLPPYVEQRIVDYYEKLYFLGSNQSAYGGQLGRVVSNYQFLFNNCTTSILNSFLLGGMEIGVNPSTISPASLGNQLELNSFLNGFLGSYAVKKLNRINSSAPALAPAISDPIDYFLSKFGILRAVPSYNFGELYYFGLA